ncbi:MAG: hypothetical protein K1000chlam4_00054, partial [Chlamydiae bacterium]|nr:hypothetical protein [Chlamydiota bacterium]
EPLLPYPAERGIVQYLTAETHSLGSRLTVIAARKDHLQNHLDKHGLAPDCVTTVPLALAALTKIFPKNNDPLLIMHIGEVEGSCVLVQEGKLLAARSFELEKNEIHKAVLAIASAHKSKKRDSILLLTEEKKLAEFVEEATGKTVLLPENTISQANISKFALALGTALASTSDDLPNFRLQDLPSPRLWKRVRKPLFTYFVCIAALFGSLFGLEQILLRNHERTLYHRYHALAKLVGEDGPPPKTHEQLYLALKRLEEKVGSRPDTFPLLPGVPKVNDLLAWFSALPQIVDENGETNIIIEKLNYTMVKKPDLSQKKEHYLVRVDLEFSANNPSLARGFHDALLAPNPMVSPKKEVTWGSSNQLYKTSFFLKDKTQYTGI